VSVSKHLGELYSEVCNLFESEDVVSHSLSLLVCLLPEINVFPYFILLKMCLVGS